MTQCKLDLALMPDLEERLARRRAIEAAMRQGSRRQAHRDSLLLSDRLTSLLVRNLLRTLGLYERGIQNALAPLVSHHQFQFENLPRDLNGFRILHLTDLHIDGIDGLAETVADRLAGVEVDLCVMTGDYRFAIQGPCDRIYPRMRTILSHVQARHGFFAILGNHDDSEIAVELERLGVRVMLNEAVPITRGKTCLWVLGVDDPHRYGCDDLAVTLAPVPAAAFKILLAHSPEMYNEASRAGVDLYLCGHTHAGQIRLPGIGALLKNAKCPRSYIQGRWRHELMQGYTSAGVGCSLLPVRYNCAPEIAVIELRSKNYDLQRV